MGVPHDATRTVAERCARRGASNRYSLLRPDVWQTLQERQHTLLQILVRNSATNPPA